MQRKEIKTSFPSIPFGRACIFARIAPWTRSYCSSRCTSVIAPDRPLSNCSLSKQSLFQTRTKNSFVRVLRSRSLSYSARLPVSAYFRLFRPALLGRGYFFWLYFSASPYSFLLALSPYVPVPRILFFASALSVHSSSSCLLLRRFSILFVDLVGVHEVLPDDVCCRGDGGDRVEERLGHPDGKHGILLPE